MGSAGSADSGVSAVCNPQCSNTLFPAAQKIHEVNFSSNISNAFHKIRYEVIVV